jgi:hypothetical protein
MCVIDYAKSKKRIDNAALNMIQFALSALRVGAVGGNM